MKIYSEPLLWTDLSTSKNRTLRQHLGEESTVVEFHAYQGKWISRLNEIKILSPKQNGPVGLQTEDSDYLGWKLTPPVLKQVS